MRYLTLVPILLAAACSTGPNNPNTQQTGKDEFSLAYGEDAAIPGTIARLGFEQVTHESRCPSDVVCIWEGQVTLLFGVTVGDGPTVPLEITLRGGASAPVTVQGITLTLFRVDPYPVTTEPHGVEDYVAVFRVGAGATSPN
jgi:hypothetical protein